VTARRARVLVLAALAAAAVLIGVELARGGLGYGAPEVRDPCARHAPFGGGGLDGATQRVALRGLDVAACRLGITREELLLALAGQQEVGRSSGALEDALREGLAQAIDEQDLDPVSTFVLRQAVRHAPASWVLAIARRLGVLR
jgi:hypothetical protein